MFVSVIASLLVLTNAKDNCGVDEKTRIQAIQKCFKDWDECQSNGVNGESEFPSPTITLPYPSTFGAKLNLRAFGNLRLQRKIFGIQISNFNS